MHTGSKTLLLGDPSAQIPQLDPFFPAERAAETLLVLGSNPGEITQHLVTPLRKMKCIVTAILRAPPALNDSFGFKFINQRHHAAGHHPEMFRQGLLTDARVGCDLPQQPRIGSR